MSTPSIKVGQGNWGIKTGNLLGYANTEKKFSPVEFTSTRALSTATRVNASGNIEGVNANVPRIDYFGGQASLLVEPSSANLMLYSQAINSWPTKGGLTITDNNAISPDGTQNASYIQQTTGGNVVSLQSAGINISLGQAQSVTFFAKAAEITSLTLRFGTGSLWGPSGTRPQFTFDLTNGAVTLNAGSATLSSQNFGNGWYRYSIVTPATIASGQTTIQTVTNAVFSPNSGDGFYLWGVQWEQNISTPTSYIPTTTGTVTRNADVISVTGVAGLIGQTEGTIYAEVDLRNSILGSLLVIDDGDTSDFISIARLANLTIRAQIRRAGGSITTIITSSAVALGVHKIALAYTNGDYALYIDGVSAGTSTNSTDYPATSLTQCVLSNTNYGPLNDRIRAASIYQTRLPNTTTDGSPSLQSITTL